MKSLKSPAVLGALLLLALSVMVPAQLDWLPVGAGWVGIGLVLVAALTALFWSGPAVDAGESVSSSVAPPLYGAAIDALQSGLVMELRQIEQESDRVGALISDAVVGLRDSFLRLNDLSERQCRIARCVRNEIASEAAERCASGPINGLHSRCAEILELGEAVELAVQDAVRALQFEDISAQTLAGMKLSLGTLHELTELAGQMRAADQLPSATTLNQIIEQYHILHQNALERAARPTVSQQNLSEGDVELF